MKQHKKESIKKRFRIDEITLVIIVIALAFIVGIYEKSGNSAKRIDAYEITEIIFDDHYMSFVNDGVIDPQKLEEIKKMDYIALKNGIDAKNDFCMYIEDTDGNVLLAKSSSKLSEEISHCRE